MLRQPLCSPSEVFRGDRMVRRADWATSRSGAWRFAMLASLMAWCLCRWRTAAVLVAAAACLAACGDPTRTATPHGGDAAASVADTAAARLPADASAADSLAEPGADAAGPGGDATAADSVADGAVAVAKGLAVSIDAAVPAVGTLFVFALPMTALAQPSGPGPGDAKPLAIAQLEAWPWQSEVDVPDGTWVIGAMVTQGGFDPAQAVAMGLTCSGGKPQPVVSLGHQVSPASVQLQLQPIGQGDPISQQCGGGGVAPAEVLTPTFQVSPPSTQAGGAHLLDAIQAGPKLWVAGHADSWISFDLDGQSPASGLAGWQPQGKGLCARVERVGTRLFCSARRDQLATATIDLKTGAAKDFALIQMLPDARGDGMAEVDGALVVAAHQLGLVAHMADPPYVSKPLDVNAATGVPPLLDPWDIARFGNTGVVVADGEHGLQVGKVTAVSPLTLQMYAHLPLPGLSAFVEVVGQQVLVASPSGRLTVVDLSKPTQPIVQSTQALPSPVFAATAVAGVAVAAAGSHLYAFDLPPLAAPTGPLKWRGLLRSWNYSLDVEPYGAGGIVSAEFAALRTLAVDPKAATVPRLVVPKSLFVRAGAVGLPLSATLDVWAAGGEVTIEEVRWRQGGDVQQPAVVVAGTTVVKQGAAKTLHLALPKTVKGQTGHLLELVVSGGATEVLQVQETALLGPGDPLPPLAFQDAQGNPVDVQAHIQGKPAVVIVAAHTCPVALVGLAAIVAELRLLVQSGTVAAVAIDPWDKPIDAKEALALDVPFPVLYSALTTADNHNYSSLQQQTLALPTSSAGSMPMVFVVDAKGTIVEATAGYEPLRLKRGLQSLGVPLGP